MKTKNKNQKRAVFLLAGLAVLLTGLVVSQVSASDKPKTREGRFHNQDVQAFSQSARFLSSLEKDHWQNEYISQNNAVDFSFNAIGARWQGSVPPGASVVIQVRVFNKIGSEWVQLPEPEDENILKPSREHYTDPIFVKESKYFQYKITVRPNEDFTWPKISNLEIIYLNTGQTNSWFRLTWLEKLFAKETQAASGLKIISREEWGADESYRLNSQGQESWPSTYQTVQKFVIHHTAGGNGLDNPSATIRGIYYWHAIVRGWGDIGYNFLIDGQGNIYEGRFGGDQVIGAHVFNEAKNINYNEGSIGIAVLGCYDTSWASTGNPACATKHTLNQKVQSALADLIADKSYLHGISPLGQSMFIDRVTANVVGHADLDATLCPGNRILKNIGKVRIAAQQQFLALGGSKMKYASEFISHNIVPATFLAEPEEVEVVFKNTGTEIWEKNKLVLKTYDLKDEVNAYIDSSWLDDYGMFESQENQVETDQQATFRFTLRTPGSLGLYKQIYKLFYDGEEIAGGRFSLNTRADSRYQAQLIKHNIPLAMLNFWRMPTTVQFKNTGVTTWNKNLVLSVYDANWGQSMFFDKSWKSTIGRFKLMEKEVKPGALGTFKFYLDAPYHPGIYTNILQLEILGQSDVIVQNGEVPLLTRVDG